MARVFFDGRSSGGIETGNTLTLSNVMCTSSLLLCLTVQPKLAVPSPIISSIET